MPESREAKIPLPREGSRPESSGEDLRNREQSTIEIKPLPQPAPSSIEEVKFPPNEGEAPPSPIAERLREASASSLDITLEEAGQMDTVEPSRIEAVMEAYFRKQKEPRKNE